MQFDANRDCCGWLPVAHAAQACCGFFAPERRRLKLIRLEPRWRSSFVPRLIPSTVRRYPRAIELRSSRPLVGASSNATPAPMPRPTRSQAIEADLEAEALVDLPAKSLCDCRFCSSYRAYSVMLSTPRTCLGPCSWLAVRPVRLENPDGKGVVSGAEMRRKLAGNCRV